MTLDTETLIVLLLPWALWLGWEIFLLIRRGEPRESGQSIPKTISMVARDRAAHLSSIIFLWGGMASHWWWPSASSATVAGSVIFWLLVLLLLTEDIILWRSDPIGWIWWLKAQRNPVALLLLGFMGGKFLFPQAG